MSAGNDTAHALSGWDDHAHPAVEPDHWHDVQADDDGVRHRRIILTTAASIKPRPVHWAWQGRLPVGTFNLLAGREGLGKSSCGYWMTAQITCGTLPGEYFGTPHSVMIAATEDSWAHTIVPRLMAASADLNRVYRIDVITSEGTHDDLSLPADVHRLAELVKDHDVKLVLLDPLMSRLSSTIDTHKDADTRRALEPIAAFADAAQVAVLGLIHHNKGKTSDPLDRIMASKAFTAVARSIHTVVEDSDDESGRRRLFGTVKSNLGPTSDLPMLAFTIESHVIPTDEGDAITGRLQWVGEVAGNIGEAMRKATELSNDGTQTQEASDWLSDYMHDVGGEAFSKDVKAAGRKAGHSDSALQRARSRLGLEITHRGYPRQTIWALVVSPVVSPAWGDETTEMNETTRPVVSVVSVIPPVEGPDSTAPIEGGD